MTHHKMRYLEIGLPWESSALALLLQSEDRAVSNLLNNPSYDTELSLSLLCTVQKLPHTMSHYDNRF
jgi:hypothetical protein